VTTRAPNPARTVVDRPEARFRELDWNADGTVSFREFLVRRSGSRAARRHRVASRRDTRSRSRPD
jgi:hypothetical protein